MQIYLPIAEVSVNAFLLLGLGGIVGILSGMFGVGGGFLLTPLLFFVGIPPAVAVATGADQIVASSISGVLAHFRRKTVDLKLGVGPAVGRHGRGGARGPAVRRDAGDRPGRSAGPAFLRGLSRRHRRADAERKPERDPAGPGAG